MAPLPRRLLVLSTAATLFLAGPLDAQGKDPIQTSDYGKFENLRDGWLSPDGNWLGLPIGRVNEENELRIRSTVEPGKDPVVVAFGARLSFSDDSKWAAYEVGMSREAREKLTKAKKPVQNKAGILELASGEKETINDVQSFSFSGSGRFLALHKYPPESKDTGEKDPPESKDAGDEDPPKGANLLVRDFQTGITATLGNVSAFAWQDEGDLLAILVNTPDKTGNGVQLYDPASAGLRVLDSSGSYYRHLTWRKESDDLAVIRSLTKKDREGEAQVLLAWRGLSGGNAQAFELDAHQGAIPDDKRVVSYRSPAWTEDGSAVWIGVSEWEVKPDKNEEKDEKEADGEEQGGEKKENATYRAVATYKPAGVEVWHAKDARSMPEQKKDAKRDRERYLTAAWFPGQDKIVMLGEHHQENVILSGRTAAAVAADWSAYPQGRMFGRPFSDYSAIDTGSGERKPLGKYRFQQGISPGGRFIVVFDGQDYHSMALATGNDRNLTGDLRVAFANLEDDHPVDISSPNSGWRWTKTNTLLVRDEFDVWELTPDGSQQPRKLTDGRTDDLQFRVANPYLDESLIDMDRPVYFEVFGKWTKKSGFAALDRSKGETAARILIMRDKGLSQLRKAEHADTLAFLERGFDDSPDFFVTDPSFESPRQVTESNAFLKDYAWGRGELIEYANNQGKRLQGALFYPANYDPSKKYPMIVYFYERLSQQLHNFWTPDDKDYYNPAVWTANGYFTLMPDITYQPRDPGVSAVDCVEAAIDAAVAKTSVNPAKVGVIGHSWGGYEANYLATRSKKLAAAVSGAGLTDLVSMAGSVFWVAGVPESSHFEVGQERMQVPLWEDRDAYIRNSPVHWVHEMQTPLLMEFGDNDRNVHWHQAWELYNFARRASKQVVMVVYNGADHGLRKPENRSDYHLRILQWFGHYLKDEPAPDWITEGQTLLEREEEVKKIKDAEKKSSSASKKSGS